VKRLILGMAVVVVLVWVGTARAGVNIITVPVGNLGNANDDTGYGRVDYAYNIGKYEVTAGQYTEFLNAVAETDTYGLYSTLMDHVSKGCQITRHGTSGSYTYDFSGGTVEVPGSTASDWENRPVNYVGWGDAARFANWLHNGKPTGAQDLTTTEDGAYFLNGATTDEALLAVTREADWKCAIPTENELYKAAYHKNDGVTGNYFHYPTSSDTPPGYIDDSGNFSRTGDGSFTEGGTDPGNYATYNGDGGIDGIGSPYYRNEVGEHENSVSPYGTFDQGGNLWDWTEGIYYDSYRNVRGGWFDSHDGHLHASHRDGYYPTYEDVGPILGFRVASVPEPGSITLLVCGALGLLTYAWRRRRLS